MFLLGLDPTVVIHNKELQNAIMLNDIPEQLCFSNTVIWAVV